MADVFSGVDTVMSKKFFRHMLDVHKERVVSESEQKTSHTKKSTGKKTDVALLKKQVNVLETELEALLSELSKVQQPVSNTAVTVEKPPKKEESEKSLLLAQLHDLEKRLMNYENRPNHNQDHIKSLKERIFRIKTYLKV